MVAAVIGMITFHEFFHFITARMMGMKVTEFSFGFGPRLVSVTKGETTYGIRLLPLGGFVNIVGVRPDDEVPPEDEPRAFRSRPLPARIVVLLAGVVSHLLVAFALLFAMFAVVGVPGPVPVVDAFYTPGTTTTLSPAYTAGVRAGDRFVAIDGTEVSSTSDMVNIVSNSDASHTFTVDRAGTLLTFEIPSVPNADGQPRIGVQFAMAPTPLPAGRSASLASSTLWDLLTLSSSGAARMLSPTSLVPLVSDTVTGTPADVDSRPLSPIGLAQIGTQIAGDDTWSLLWILAAVSVALGIINALPLYPLDGGRAAVEVVEAIRRRPFAPSRLAKVAAVVMTFFLLLGVLAMVLDVTQPVVLPT